MTCIDVFSKHAWVVPLTDKKGSTLVTALGRVLDKSRRKPRSLQTDKGSEFLNSVFQKYLKERHIDFFVSENEDIKASVVERFNRTLKEKLWRYFTHQSTLTYTDVLEDLVEAYNRTFHSSIRARPVDVNRDNQERVWQTLYGQTEEKSSPRLSPGDHVRLTQARRPFKKGYLPSWTEEVFVVLRAKPTHPVTYEIADLSGEPIRGTFYEQELQKIAAPAAFKIEAILRTKGRAPGSRQFLVKWKGYPASFNSWIDERDLVT